MANRFSVDRVRFLAAAAAIAGVASFQACTIEDVTTANSDDGSGGDSSGGKNSAGTSSNPGGATHVGATDGGATDVGATDGGATSGGAADVGATNGGAAGREAADGGASGAAGAGDPGGCHDTVGIPSCAGVTAACSGFCNAAIANLKAAAAVAAVTCIKNDKTANCDTGYSCEADATIKGCAEDVEIVCESALTSCTSASTQDPPCNQLLSGLNEAARDLAVSCVDGSCFSVYACVEGLFYL